MKKHKSYILIMIFFLSNAFSLQAMLNRLSRIPQAQPVPRRNISGLGKSKVRPSLLPLGGVNSRVNQNSFVNSAAKPLNSPTNSWFQNVQRQYQASPISSLVNSLAWTAALGLLPFGVVVIDLDKMFDGLKSIRQKIEPFFITPKPVIETKSDQEIKNLSDSSDDQQDEVLKNNTRP